MSELIDRLNDPHRRLVLSDRQEAAVVIIELQSALLLARLAILRETANTGEDALNAIDTALGNPVLSSDQREKP